MRRKFLTDAIRVAASLRLLPHRFRPTLLRRSGVTVQGRLLMYGGASFHGSALITFEDDVFVNQNCHFDSQASIYISSGTRIGDHVRLITSSHEIGPASKRAGASVSKSLRIGKGVWMGSGSCVLPGADVADGCVIAAGAVVTMPTMPHGLYAGVPARRVRELDTTESLMDDSPRR